MTSAATKTGLTVSDTAKWVAMYRALESERPDALFHDPYARRLAGVEGENILNSMPQGRAYAWPMIVRTAMIDEFITEALARDGIDLIVNLAAGLDARPYRMQLPSGLQWVEVDYPWTIEQKTRALASDRPRCKLDRIGADLADADARRALLARVNEMGTNGLVITEGLMVYLAPEQAGAFADDLAAQPHLRFWVTDIVAPFILKMMRRRWGRNLAAAPFLFAPEEGASFYERHGWHFKQYRSMVLEARRYGRESNMSWLWRLFFSRAIRREATKRSGPMTGTVLLSKEP